MIDDFILPRTLLEGMQELAGYRTDFSGVLPYQRTEDGVHIAVGHFITGMGTSEEPNIVRSIPKREEILRIYEKKDPEAMFASYSTHSNGSHTHCASVQDPVHRKDRDVDVLFTRGIPKIKSSGARMGIRDEYVDEIAVMFHQELEKIGMNMDPPYTEGSDRIGIVPRVDERELQEFEIIRSRCPTSF